MPTIIDPDIRPYHLCVYEALREAWIDYGSAPSQMELVAAIHCSTQTIKEAVNYLRNKGYIEAPKHAVRMMKPTNIDLVILRAEPDPWDELKPPKKYWAGPRNDRYHEPDVT